MRHSILLVSLLCVPALAQQPANSPIRTEGPRLAVTRGCGLQKLDQAPGLIGGGADYEVHFGTAVRVEPVLGRNCPMTQHLTLRAEAVLRADETVLTPPGVLPAQDERTAIYRHAPGCDERYEVRPDGVALSWRFEARPAGHGDLVVRYRYDTTLGRPSRVGDSFELNGPHGGVRVGGVTGIAADGRRVAGNLRWEGEHLELSLPASFVDTATYPLVLDPLIGPIVPVSFSLNFAEFDPDVAHSEIGYWLVVWRRDLSASTQPVRGQRINVDGTLRGSTLFFSSSGAASAPRVSSNREYGGFGVVWTQTASGTHSVQFQSLPAYDVPQLPTPILLTTIASNTTDAYPSAVIGSDMDSIADPGSEGYLVVWEDDATNTIRRRAVRITLGGAVQMTLPLAIWTNGALGPFYEQPAISRHAVGTNRMLVVARRRPSPIGGSAIVGQFVDSLGIPIGATATIASSTTNDLFAPAVDGHGNRWIVAWERRGTAPSFDSVRVVSTDSAFILGSVAIFGGAATNQASAPTVCYAPSRTWLGYQRITALPTPTTTLQLAALRSDTCTSCNDGLTVSFPSGPRIVAAREPLKPNSVNAPPRLGFVVFDDSILDIGGQRITDAGNGTAVVQGSACGNTGSIVQATPPNIGQDYIEDRSFTGTVAFFNLTPVLPTNLCGTCEFAPLGTVVEAPPFAFWRRVRFVIPCEPSLVGEQMLTQWLVFDLGAASTPCPGFPGLYGSERRLLTIGN
jgi:hypothetical protein